MKVKLSRQEVIAVASSVVGIILLVVGLTYTYVPDVLYVSIEDGYCAVSRHTVNAVTGWIVDRTSIYKSDSASEAIQWAVDNNGYIQLAAGTYLLSETVVLTKNGTVLQGEPSSILVGTHSGPVLYANASVTLVGLYIEYSATAIQIGDENSDL